MEGFLLSLLFCLFPVLGNTLGGLVAEVVTPTPRALSLALHLAAGVVLAVIGVELMPRALGINRPWIVVVSLMLGGLFFVLVDEAIGLVGEWTGSGGPHRSPWVLFLGVAMDLFTDGVMIGTGATVATTLGLLLALSQVPADIPAGLATMAVFRARGTPRVRRLLLLAAFIPPIVLGAVAGYWGVRGHAPWVKFALLAFSAGLLLTLVVETMVPEAHRYEEARLAALLMLLGFAAFTALALYLK